MDKDNFNGNDFGGSVTSYTGGETPRETIFGDSDYDDSGMDSTGGDIYGDADFSNGVNNDNSLNSLNGAPEAYEPFTLPDGMDMNAPDVQEAMGEAESLFREIGLTQEQAQKLIDLHTKHWIGGAVEDEENFNSQLQAQIDNWGEQTKRDPEFGGSRLNQAKVYVNRAISKLGGKSLLNALTKETGVINHPAVWRAFARMGRDYFTEDKFVRNSRTGRAGDNSPIGMARRVYPDMN
ncbi:MAG: hypothetical protein IJP88_10670 [Synergistaceae bacterium]|nr:hypothetical protein [Synergistaceae bacterium]MBQ6909447.1 hypothetical protein [Synergistaceae bacterium]MBR0097637.1 hypothetical protein [Synergistaceae bacterium]